jgi:hypothetical protein
MTKEDIYQNFLKDPLLNENDYISEEQSTSLEFHQPTDIPMIEVIRIAIQGVVDGDTKNALTRKLNQLFKFR